MVNRLSLYTRSAIKALESAFLEGCCIVCGQRSQRCIDICRPCENELPWMSWQCQRCALPVSSAGAKLCGQCLLSPPVFHRAISVWKYSPPVAQLISAFKYRRRCSYGRVLSELAAPVFTDAYRQSTKPDFLLATPLHWRRHMLRGFNQSEQICGCLSRQLNIPLFRGVRRVRATRPQQAQSAQQRQKNLSGVFSLSTTSCLTDSCVAVVDDVITTGSTANELSRCLLSAGVSEVHIWSLARTVL